MIPAEEKSPEAVVSPWRGTAPELLTAAVAVTVAAVAGYAVAGWAGLTVVAVAAAAGAMVLLRALLPQLTPDAAKTAPQKPQARMLTGYSRRRFVVRSAMTSQNYNRGVETCGFLGGWAVTRGLVAGEDGVLHERRGLNGNG